MSKVAPGTAWPAQTRTSRRGKHTHHAGAPARARLAPGFGLGWALALAVLLPAAAGAHAQTAFVFSAQPVGGAQAGQNVTVTAQIAGTVNSVQVLTLGAAGLDFQKGIGALSCESATLAAGASCQESVVFAPTAPGLRLGAVVLVDSNSNVLGTSYLSGIGIGGLGVLLLGNILPVAGDGDYLGAVSDGVPATEAELNHPSSVVLDGAGNMYIADKYHHRIRMVAASTGLISTIAGNGNPAYTGDGSAAADATLDTPWGVALDGAGNLYIADTGNNAVRKIAASNGMVTTVAGNGTAGFGGDKAAAIAANLNQPQGVTVDAAGSLYIADTNNHRIRRVDADTGIITTVAGNGFTNPNGSGGYTGDGGPASAAELNFPFAVAFDSLGNIYIPDSSNNAVRSVDASGKISTLAGTGASGAQGDGGPANAANLWSPSGVLVDPAGNVYIADTQNNSIRKVSSATGVITTIAANGLGECIIDGNFAGVSIYGPIGLFMDGSGDLYFADSLNMRIREIQSNFFALDYTGNAVRQGNLSVVKYENVENDGNAPLDLTAIVTDKNAVLNADSTTCAVAALAIDDVCTIGAVFAPSVAGDPLAGNIAIAVDAINSPLDIEVVGDATPVNSTTIALASSLDPSGFGQNVTLSATVTTGKTAGTPTGTVTFMDGGTTLQASVPLNGAGVANYVTPALAVGLHSMTASYSGDATHFASKSTDGSTLPLIQTVLEATATNLSSNVNPAALGQNLAFTATVSISGGGAVVPEGTVIFTDGSTVLGDVAINSGGVAVFTTTTPLADGQHSIVATYGGDSDKQILGSISNALIEDVLTSSTVQLSAIGIQGAANPAATFGQPVIFTAIVTGSGTATAIGTVIFFDYGEPIPNSAVPLTGGKATFSISSLSVGKHSITVSYGGDSNYASSTSSAFVLTINQTVTAAAVAAVPTPGIAGAPVALTATVTVVVGAATPGGTVTFMDGTVTLGTATVTGGTASHGYLLAPGPHSIVAAYAGDTDDNGSTSAPLPIAVVLATTSVAVAATPNPSLVLAAVTFTAKVTGNGGVPTGSVGFFADGTSMGAANLDATGTATFLYSALPAGTHSITTAYAGDINDSPSTSTGSSETVGTIPTATVLGTATSSGATPQAILVATVLGTSGPTPTGTVTFSDGSTTVGSAALDASGIATFTPNLTSGSYSVVAVYGGDAIHTGSTSQPASISGTPNGYNLAVTPDSVTIQTKENINVTVTIASESGFADTIGLGCASLPAGVTCHFSSPNIGLKANAVQSTLLTIDTNNPLTGGASAMNTGRDRSSTLLASLFLPLSLFFGLYFRRLRRRNAALLATVVVLMLFGTAILATGCASFGQISTAPGTYVIQVTGAGANSNITHYQNLTLNITK